MRWRALEAVEVHVASIGGAAGVAGAGVSEVSGCRTFMKEKTIQHRPKKHIFLKISPNTFTQPLKHMTNKVSKTFPDPPPNLPKPTKTFQTFKLLNWDLELGFRPRTAGVKHVFSRAEVCSRNLRFYEVFSCSVACPRCYLFMLSFGKGGQ